MMTLQNICPNCGKNDTLWPRHRGRRKIYVCDKEFGSGGCGAITRGITKEQWTQGKFKDKVFKFWER